MGESKPIEDATPTSKEVEDPLLAQNRGRGKRNTCRVVLKQLLLVTPIFILGVAVGMPMGFSVVVTSQTENTVDAFEMDLIMNSWFTSIHSLVAPVGALMSGMIMDYRGRKYACMACHVPLILGWIVMATASNYGMMLVGRVILGFAVGLAGAPTQIYLAECAEPHIRGFLFGVLIFAYSLGILITYSLGAVMHWQHVAWIANVLPLISLFAFFLVPESPSWLARKGCLSEARKALQWLRCDEAMVQTELDDITTRLQNETLQKQRRDWRILARLSVLKPLAIINVFHLLSILSGTYLVVFYVIDIIRDISMDVNTMHAAIYTACIRVLATVVCSVLLYVINRRTLLIGSGLLSFISCLVLLLFKYIRSDVFEKTPLDTYVLAVCLLVYVAASTTFMIMPGVMIGELLPARIRGQYGGMIFCAFHVCLFIVANLFPLFVFILNTSGIFIMFGGASLLTAMFIGLFMPETKGRTLGQIEDYFQGRNWLWAMRSRESKKAFQ